MQEGLPPAVVSAVKLVSDRLMQPSPPAAAAPRSASLGLEPPADPYLGAEEEAVSAAAAGTQRDRGCNRDMPLAAPPTFVAQGPGGRTWRGVGSFGTGLLIIKTPPLK